MERTAASRISRRNPRRKVRAFLLVTRLHSVLYDHVNTRRIGTIGAGLTVKAYSAPGGLLPYKSDGGASRTFEGAKREDDYCQS